MGRESRKPAPGRHTAAALNVMRHEAAGRGQAKGLVWTQADTMAAVAANGGPSLAGLRDAAIIDCMSDTMPHGCDTPRARSWD